MHHIVHNLWLGSQRDADELIRDNPENITAILNVRGPDQYEPPGRDQSAEHPGKAYKWIPAPDIEIIYPQHVKEAGLWLREQTGKSQRILIHCMHGVSRSPAFLAAFMVENGMAANLEEARTAISAQRRVHPAKQLSEHAKSVVLVCALTGLPNRQAFDQGNASPFVAAIGIALMKIFTESYGPMATDALIRRLAKILVNVGLETYHQQGDEFLCKGESRQELNDKLSQARQSFREPIEIYADGRVQTIEETDFLFGIGVRAEEAEAALHQAKTASALNESPEWLRKILGTGGPGRGW
jgi:GGDEF domain-containing protein